MKNVTIPVLVAAAALAVGCKFSVSAGGANNNGSSGENQQDGTTSSGGDSKAAEPQVTEASKAWFKECSAHYDEFMSKWKPIDDEARKVIQETENGDFYAGAQKLTAQITKTCVSAKTTGWMLRYANNEGTGQALQQALARLQMKSKKGAVQLFDTVQFHDMVRNMPTTGDEEFDRNAFCLSVHNQGLQLPGGGRFGAVGGVGYNVAHWMTKAELDKFNAKFSSITKAASDVLEEHDKQLLHTASEYGRIKSVKKEADGSYSIVGKRIETPYECAHTGNYHWDGAGYNDCSYVDKAPVEVYSFTAHFKDVPPSDLKVGDFLMYSGQVNGKAPSNVEMANAKWEGALIYRVMRAKKVPFEIARIEVCR